MHYIVIIQDEDNSYYVGDTKNLGGLNFDNSELVAVYDVSTLGKFFRYNNLVNLILDKTFSISVFDKELIKNFDEEDSSYSLHYAYIKDNIIENMMLNDKDNWRNIRGSSYSVFTNDTNFPEDNKFLKYLPLCKCGLPCDIKKSDCNHQITHIDDCNHLITHIDESYLYFQCIKNKFHEFCAGEPCNFYAKYTRDEEVKIMLEQG